jgi:hypothetical protein
MAPLLPRFSCNAVEPFEIFRLPAWLAAEQAAGRIPSAGPISISVLHPDREMDGSCRWCGCRENEVVTIENGRIA